EWVWCASPAGLGAQGGHRRGRIMLLVQLLTGSTFRVSTGVAGGTGADRLACHRRSPGVAKASSPGSEVF
ncbi:TPA: hypothetical protein ACNV5A_004113, partial [Aeromonas hydrophila]